ncbi:MAG: alkaline phosphatase family protein, partial [Bacteroidia bacterium]|nr:alkaline phosphatase family protein [Bacteroidia bacterium]
ARPGTVDYMRSKIKNVVYYMVESRSFDNVCGWLYEKGAAGINFIGSDEPYNGASTDNYNYDGDEKVHVSQFMDGKLSDQYDLIDQIQDPFHNNSDSLVQMFTDPGGYAKRTTPNMGGFVKNNANHEVMLSYNSRVQLPILNGLAENYAISDAWYSSVPGGTDINRAFSVTGSAMNQLFTWEGGNAYEYWPDFPHRQSIWKVLYSNGIKDFKLYNAMEWLGYPFTYHLYLKGEIPSVDKNEKEFVDTLDNFLVEAKNGTLPAFSFLEPIWISPDNTTSYHPGVDIVPGEIALNQIWEAIKSGPQWENTLFVITFSKPGGMYDHAIPPYATKAWPNDCVNNFHYDIMGPRVPAIMVSPWIQKNTVFRSGDKIPFDSTSFAATLLKWFGIPKAKWALGDRMDQAPTFENIIQLENARKDAPELIPPYDKSHPAPNESS